MTNEVTLERRAAIELRVAGRRLEGYAAVFGQEAQIGRFVETIAKGAFRETLADGHDILALVDHEPSKVLGRTRSNTLRLAEDNRGLHFAIDLPNTSIAADVLALAERGDLGGGSFGFKVRDGGESWNGQRRELRAVHLAEISVVIAWPAYGGTSVAARSQLLASPRLSRARRYLETVR